MPSSGEVLDGPVREVAFSITSVNDVQVKRFIRSEPVNFKHGPRKTLEEARTAVNVAYGSSSGFPVSSDDVPIVEDEIV